MSLSASTNTAAATAHRYLSINNSAAASSLAKLSSGSRIVKASDDAASLAIGTKIKADVTALKQAAVNASHASSLLQVADGGMARIADILQRMKALSVQAQSGSVTDAERAFLDVEYQELLTQVQDIATQTRFNNAQLLDGSAGKSVANVDADLTDAGVSVFLSGDAKAGTWTLDYDGTDLFTLTDADGIEYTVQLDDPGANGVVFEGVINFASAGVRVVLNNFDHATGVTGDFDVSGTGTLTFQVGVLSTDTISVNIDNVTGAGLGIAGSNIATSAAAVTAGNNLDTALSSVNSARANVGAMISRFEFVSANLATSVENLDAARATLMDVDMAAEMTKFVSSQVLTQAAVAMLAQANQLPQNLLRLLQ